MDKNTWMEIGKDNIKSVGMSDHINILPDIIFEILGTTNAKYYGTTEIKDIKKSLDTENEIFDYKFYKYVDYELQECSFIAAFKTQEYEKDRAFIFSELSDDKRIIYVALIIND